jgi:hypothetical protein
MKKFLITIAITFVLIMCMGSLLVSKGLFGAGAQGTATPEVTAVDLASSETVVPTFVVVSTATDDFSKEDKLWYVTDGSAEGGTISYKDGRLVLAPEPGYIKYTTYATALLADVSVSADAYLNNDNYDADYGLICRETDANNFYYAAMTAGGRAGIGVMIDGSRQLLSGDTMATTDAIALNGVNHLQLDCIQNRIVFTINGVQVAVATDSSLSTGQTGFYVSAFGGPAASVGFDNYSLSIYQ